MYRQLQEKVRQHVINVLCQISNKWKFDIDTENIENPIIVGYGPNDEIIRTPIEKIHWYATEEMIDSLANIYNLSSQCVKGWGGCMLIKKLIDSVFPTYGIAIYHHSPLVVTFEVISRDESKKIESRILGIINDERRVHYVSPFISGEFVNCIMEKQLVPPILLLLDPIEYFRRYSVIIKKYPILANERHTLGIYELLLEYFPEMNEELAGKYFALQYIFRNKWADIIFLIGGILVDLYVC